MTFQGFEQLLPSHGRSWEDWLFLAAILCAILGFLISIVRAVRARSSGRPITSRHSLLIGCCIGMLGVGIWITHYETGLISVTGAFMPVAAAVAMLVINGKYLSATKREEQEAKALQRSVGDRSADSSVGA